MKRRGFLQLAGASLAFGMAPRLAFAATAPASPASVDGRLLVLVELKGGNDGLNTLIPYRDPTYYALRPQIGIKPEGMIRLDDRVALHRALEPLMPSWEEGRLAIIQGVGYPQPNLSHFRSIEIWDTASRSDQYLPAGWLTRLFRDNPLPARYAADALVLGSADLGPVAGGARAIALDNPGQFNKQAKLVQAMAGQGDNALGHVLKVESDIATAARSLGTGGKLSTAFPTHNFGRLCRVACETLASASGVAVVRLTLGSFDTHQNQVGTHANLLTQLAEGLSAFKAGMIELGRWDDTLVATYSEFGRRPKENASGGTDHGTIAPHFVLGGRVRGGLLGETPDLSVLDASGNLPYRVDFRQVYATLLERWWQVPAAPILGGRFSPLEVV